MNPCRTAALGLLLVGLAIGQDSNLYAVGDLQYDNQQADAPYWWMNKGSPFKRSYTSETGCGSLCESNTLQVGSNGYASNPFLNSIADPNEYLGANSNDEAYAAPGYLPPLQETRTITCSSTSQVCVSKYLCRNGYIDRDLIGETQQTCNADSDVCCTVREAPVTPAPKPVQLQTTPCLDKNYGCVSPDQCYNGEVVSSPNNYADSRPPTQKCYAPEVCCRFPDQSPSPNQPATSNIFNTERPETTRPYYTPPSEVLTSEGYVITVPKTPFPAAPTETPRPYQPVQTPRPYQPPVQTQTPRPYSPPVQTQTPRPYSPPVQTQTPRPYSPPVQTQTPRPYSPPVQTQTPRPYSPPVQKQTPRPYQPPVQTQTPRPYQPQTPRPYQPPAPVTPPKYQGEQYIPPHVGDSSNNNPNYLPPNQNDNGEDIKSEPIPRPSNDNPSVIRLNRPAPPPLPPTQCPAATNCTEIEFCTSIGVISKTPIILTPEQQIYRVPLSDCRNLERGFVGKCCRDPDYVDPWPVGILGQYNATILGFDDGSYKPPAPGSQRNVPAQRPLTGSGSRLVPNFATINNNNNIGQRQPIALQPNNPIRGFPEAIPSASNQIPTRGEDQKSLPIGVTPSQSTPTQYNPYSQPQQNPLYQPNRQRESNQIEPIASGSGICAVRDSNAIPQGVGPFDAAFGEFPWQAMVLKESTKSLICGGAIIQADTVLTAANCVEGLPAYDVLIKGGEWKLGSDEEPKTFQTVRVKSISFHPEYKSYGRDVALLHLEIGLKFDSHIAPICIDENDFEPTPGVDQCVCTGWGKEALKYHAADALMHQIPIQPLELGECTAALPGFNPNTAVCGRPQVDACQTDVGSALACHNGNNQYLLKGIYSTENQCNSPAQIVTFGKVDVDWIKATMEAPNYHQPRLVPHPQQPQLKRPIYGDQQLSQPQRQSPEPSQLQQVTYSIPSTKAPTYLPPRK